MKPLDWAHFAHTYWNRSIAKLTDAAPFDVGSMFDMACRCSAPFRAGTRFQATPDVRFHVLGASLAAPGELLPTVEDGSLDGYLSRITNDPRIPGFQLRIVQPLALDFSWWSTMRDRLQGLWHEVGLPLSPAIVELTIGHGVAVRALLDETSHAELNWVAQGRVRLRLLDSRSGITHRLQARAGQLLCWPAHCRLLDSELEQGVLVRVRIPFDRRLPAVMIKQALIESVQAQRGQPDEDQVPYLPLLRVTRGRASASVGPLTDTAHALSALGKSVDLARTLRINWLRRVSAAALEPVPIARKETALPPSQYLRMPSPDAVVRMRDGRHGWIWAVNGHVFSLRGALATRLLARLRDGITWHVAELCDEQDEGVLALLQRLYVLHAIVLVDAEN